MNTFDDLSGGKFGKLLVVGRAEDHIKPSGKRETQYACVCECGKTVVVRRKNLIDGHSKSCGCIGKGRKPKVKPNPPPYESCVYNAEGIECRDGWCYKCGWNPKNIELREARLAKLKRKELEE